MEGDIHDLHLFIPPHLLPTLHAHTPRHNTQTQNVTQHDARMSSARQGKLSETGTALLQACQSKNNVEPKTAYSQKQRRAKTYQKQREYDSSHHRAIIGQQHGGRSSMVQGARAQQQGFEP